MLLPGGSTVVFHRDEPTAVDIVAEALRKYAACKTMMPWSLCLYYVSYAPSTVLKKYSRSVHTSLDAPSVQSAGARISVDPSSFATELATMLSAD